MTVPRLSTLLTDAGFTVTRWKDGLVVDGQKCVVRPTDGAWGLLARAPRVVTLGTEAEHAERAPVRYVFLNKARDCVLVLESSLSRFWYHDRGKLSAPLCLAEFVRIHGAAQSYVIADLMKDRVEPTRRLSQTEARWLHDGRPRDRTFVELLHERFGAA